ncbi:MAG TPA: hypothetical protein VFL71_13305 [Actinomycetes bacterium]|nr:hypothetical protein [Actinomycetes bacterium]
MTVRQDPAQEQEWLQENNVIYGALIGVGVVMVQPFLTAASLDLPARVCVVALSVAIPLLAVLVVVNRQEVSAVVRPGPPSSPSRRRSRGTPPSSAWAPGWGSW